MEEEKAIVIARQIYEFCKNNGKDEEDLVVLSDYLGVRIGEIITAAHYVGMKIDLYAGKLKL